MTWQNKLTKMKACTEAIEWANQYETLAEAWADCERGDWMLWYVGKKAKTLAQRKKLVFAACQCARLDLVYVPEGELRPLQTIETTEAWANGKATLDEVRAAGADAWAAEAAAWAAARAARAAEDAAWAAGAAAWAAGAAAGAAGAAEDAAWAAGAAGAAGAARAAVLKDCANIVRKYYPEI